MTIEEVVCWCANNEIINYTINDDMTINVNGDVKLNNRNLLEIELNFKRVDGNFDCSVNILTSLKGCPEYVGGDFHCYLNNLTSLQHSPEYVGHSYRCYGNQLTSLKGCATHINGKFDCDWNKITDLGYLPEYIGGDFSLNFNPIDKRFNINNLNVGGKLKTYKVFWKF